MGDGVMAVFPEGADDALAAGIATQNRIKDFNQDLVAVGEEPIRVGIGLHVGHIMVGMVGEESRIQGDAFSDNVNLTARLEGLTKYYGVSLLISEQTFNNLTNVKQYQMRFLDRAIVKGRNEPIAFYQVLDVEEETVRETRLNTQPDFDQGIIHYREGNLSEARAYFEKVQAVDGGDKTVALYLQRVDQLTERGLPEGWDGVWAFTRK